MAQAEFTVHLDMLNEPAFLDVIQRAIDLCACAEDVVEQVERDPYTTPNVGRLENAAREFRGWFRGVDTSE